MAIRKRGKSWIIDYYYNGRRIRETVGESKKLAEKALAIRKAAIAQERFKIQDTKKLSTTFGEYAQEFIEGYAKNNKRSWRRDVTSLKQLLPIFENKRLIDMTPSQIERYKAKRLKEVSPATLNRELALTKTIFNHAIKNNRAIYNPMKDVKLLPEKNRRLRILSEEEIHRLIECCTPQIRPIVITALNTGMRLGEIIGLLWEDIDFKRNLIYLDKTKSGSPRQIPINDVLKSTLLSIDSRNSSNYVFLNKYGRPYKCIKNTFKTALRKANIDNFCFHQLRSVAASYLVMGGVDLVTVMEILGHRTISMTMRYAHLSAKHRHQAVTILQRRLGFHGGHKSVTNKEIENGVVQETSVKYNMEG